MCTLDFRAPGASLQLETWPSLNTADLLSLKGLPLSLSVARPPPRPPPTSFAASPSSPYLRSALAHRLRLLLSVIKPLLMAYSFCSSSHISLVYFPTLVNLGTCHKRCDIRAIISGNYQIPPPPLLTPHLQTPSIYRNSNTSLNSPQTQPTQRTQTSYSSSSFTKGNRTLE